MMNDPSQTRAQCIPGSRPALKASVWGHRYIARSAASLITAAGLMAGTTRVAEAQCESQEFWRLQTSATVGSTTPVAAVHRAAGSPTWIVAIGAFHEDVEDLSDAGAVHVFTRTDDGAWAESPAITELSPEAGSQFGIDVAVDSDWMIVGQSDENRTGRGSAHVFHYEAGEWAFHQELIPGDSHDGMLFGSFASIDGEWAVLGAYKANASLGAAYVYHLEGGAWFECQKLTPGDETGEVWFGYGVGISGDHIVVGASWANNRTGAAYTFERAGDGCSWVQDEKRLTVTSELLSYPQVAIQDDIVVVGGPSADNDQGVVYVFRQSGDTWIQEDELRAPDGAPDHLFGGSIAIDAGFVVVGAQRNGPGAGYVFRDAGSGNWVMDAKLTGSDAEQHFAGAAVAGELAVVSGESANGLTGYVFPGISDCNEDQATDLCGLVDGSLDDCDSDGIPDVCEPDCDGDGTPDDCDPDACCCTGRENLTVFCRAKNDGSLFIKGTVGRGSPGCQVTFWLDDDCPKVRTVNELGKCRAKWFDCGGDIEPGAHTVTAVLSCGTELGELGNVNCP